MAFISTVDFIAYRPGHNLLNYSNQIAWMSTALRDANRGLLNRRVAQIILGGLEYRSLLLSPLRKLDIHLQILSTIIFVFNLNAFLGPRPVGRLVVA